LPCLTTLPKWLENDMDYKIVTIWSFDGNDGSHNTLTTFVLPPLENQEIRGTSLVLLGDHWKIYSHDLWIVWVNLKVEVANDPYDHDTDGDGIWDGIEVLQANHKLNGAPSVDLDFDNDGVSDAQPGVQDIFVEVDWMTGAEPPASLKSDIEDRSKIVFLTQGIRFHVDLDGEVPADDVLDFTEWDARFARDFRDERQGIFHYALFALRVTDDNACGAGETGNAGGQGRAGPTQGDMFVIFNYDRGCSNKWATFIHELGHNILGYLDGDLGNHLPNDFAHSPYPCDIMSKSYVSCGSDYKTFHINIWTEIVKQGGVWVGLPPWIGDPL
jgi:hypothetical protein